MLKTIFQIFFPPMKSNRCPYCGLDWKYKEEFRFIGKRCVFRYHDRVGQVRPSSYYVEEARELLEENGYKVVGSLFEHGHYVILLGGQE